MLAYALRADTLAELAGFERLQISKQVVDFGRGEYELRHLPRATVADNNPFGQRFGQSLYIIALVQGSKRRSRSIGT